MEPLRHTSVVRFGAYEVSLQSGEVRKAGLRIRVQQQPMKLLEILLERPGEVVTREELRSRVWADESFGDFDQAVNIAIAKLRSALGDSADNPRFIETLPKRGYRFIADVSVVDADARPKRSEFAARDLPATEPGDKLQGAGLAVAPKRRLWPALRVIVALALVLGLPILAVWLFRSRGRAPTGIRSLAVLPLDNLSGDASQNYFADGMTDELITDLAQISALRVISRTSVMVYKGARKPLPEIARELNVDAVVEGTVLRSGEQVRVTAQLIQAPADKHLWAESYEGNLRDTLVLQKRVARAIVERIRIELTPQEQAGLKDVKAVNPEAYEDYLKGRYFWNKRTADGMKKAIDYFNQVIAKDPNYAPAYSGLADSYALLSESPHESRADALNKARVAADKALALDNKLAEAHVSRGLLFVEDLNFKAAEQEYQRAIELNPNYAFAHYLFGFDVLTPLGDFDHAISEMNRAVEHRDAFLQIPFENLSRDPDNAFFTDGVQDEILADLAKVADLKVISRTSVMQYKSGVQRNLREIAQQLGVAHLLEGSVQRAGGKVRVNSQLI